MIDPIERQAAIDRINKQREHLQPDIYPQDKIGDAAYRICAEFIERLPSAQPEKCEDCLNFIKARLLIPQPERKKGKWVLINGAAGVYECDQCHERVCCVGKYCMNCGLPMEVDER